MRTEKKSTAVLLGLVCVLLVWPAIAVGGEFRLKSDTLLRVFERDTSSGDDDAVLPAYEYLQLDIGSLESRGLSFHLYGWGRHDFLGSDFFADQTDSELLYGYVEYMYPDSSFKARLGRQHVFAGVANESIDGLLLSSNLGRYFTGSVYSGQPVGLDSTDGDNGDSIYGGRFAHRLGGSYEIGLSYKNSENDGNAAEELAGLDLAFYLPNSVSVFGNSVLNLESEGWGAHSYEVRFNLDNLILRPHFEMFQYEDYFAAGANAANPFKFLALADEELNLYGFDATWQYSDAWEFGTRLKAYEYDHRDAAQYVSLLANWSGEGATSYGAELGFMMSDAADNEYLLTRLFYYQDDLPEQYMIGFLSGDIVYVDYGEDIYGEGSSLLLSLGAGKRYLEDRLAIEVSGDYSRDPYFNDDLQVLVKMTYRLNQDL